VNYNDLESLLLFLIQLLTTCNFFDKFLNNDLVMMVGFTWCYFNVIVGTEDDAFYGYLSTGSGFELFKLTFDLMDGWGII